MKVGCMPSEQVHLPEGLSLEILTEIREVKKTLIGKGKPFLTLEEASDYLRISKNTLYGYTSQSLIPHFKVKNRRIYFKVDDLNEFVLSKKNRVSTFREIETATVLK
jgi:excisionase family DNA binding protein